MSHERKVREELNNLLHFAQERNLQVLEIQATMGDMLTLLIPETWGILHTAVVNHITPPENLLGYPFRIAQQLALICK